MADKYINKVIIGNDVKLDLTGDTIAPEDLKKNVTAHDKSGAPIVGTNTNDADTQDATAAAAELLDSKTAYARGVKITGTMPNQGSKTLTIAVKTETPAIPMGFHDGSGKAQIDADEQAKIIPGNIKQGVSILGVEGTYGGEAVKAQANKNVTPTMAQQVITPDAEYDYLAQVTVAAIPITYTDNAAGGQTLAVGA
jgi:hypothetical protein|nr:MAG TPA: tail protein [Caudoviricetes sp.]